MVNLTGILQSSIDSISKSVIDKDVDGHHLKQGLTAEISESFEKYLKEYKELQLVLRLSLASYFLSFFILFYQRRGQVQSIELLSNEELGAVLSCLAEIFLKDDIKYKDLQTLQVDQDGSEKTLSFLNHWLKEKRPFSASTAKTNFILDVLIRFDLVNGTRLSSRLLNDIRYIVYTLAMHDDRMSYDEKMLLDFLEQETIKVKAVIGDDSKIDLESYAQDLDLDQKKELLDEARSELNSLIGLGGIKDEIRRLEAFLKIQRRREELGLPIADLTLHFVFRGNPGTGKTTVARILGKLFKGLGFLGKGHVEETDRSGLVAEYVGQTATKTLAKAEAALDGILFIDEAYSLSRSAGGGEDSFGQEAIETVLKFMEDNRDRVVVIVAGYPLLMEEFIDTNPGLKSRFTRYLDFEDFTPEELCKILQLFAGKGQYIFTKEALKALGVIFAAAYEQRHNKGFGNGRFVRNLFEKILQRQALRLAEKEEPAEKEELSTILLEDLPKHLDDVEFDLTEFEHSTPCEENNSTDTSSAEKDSELDGEK